MKDIKGYEGLYAVTSCGRVWSYKNKSFIKGWTNIKNGYLYVTLFKDGKRSYHLIHRLVAEAYISNLNNYETVDHIDNCKTHNWVNNLQWMTRGDNCRKGRGHRKAVRCIENGVIYESGAAAARDLNLNGDCVTRVCRKQRDSTGGYHFEFV